MIAGLPHRLVRYLAEDQGISVAVETGTYQGASTRTLAETFDRVVSIEFSRDLHEKAKPKLADLPNVSLLCGSSIDLMPDVVRDLEPAVFWLDGHWCEGAGTVGKEKQCPVLEEIAAIDQGPGAAGACLLIDDARFFLGAPHPPYRREDWPTLPVLVDQIRAKHDRTFTVLDDVLIAGPPQIQQTLDRYWIERQFEDVLAERHQLREELWFPSFLGAARVSAKAILRRKNPNY